MASTCSPTAAWPIALDDVLAARERLRAGLRGFVAVPDAAIAEAIRVLLRTTHNLAERAGAAGLMARREELAGQAVGVVVTGGNLDEATLRRVLRREI